MPRRYDQLRTAAFQLNLAPGDRWVEQFAVLEFPEGWKGPLLDLARAGSPRGREQTSIPIDGLNRSLRALVPDIISVASYAARHNSRPWLYCATRIEPQALYPIIHAWVRAEFSHAPQEKVREVLGQMRPEQLRWQAHEVDLADWRTCENGTPLGNSELFSLLPDVLAAQLSQPHLACVHKSGESRFRRAPVLSGRGAELVSWPPHWPLDRSDRSGQRWPFSFTLTLTVQTVPFQSFAVVHCDVGVRRWVNRRFTLPDDRETSVYLLSTIPWIDGLHNSRSFQVAPIKWEWIPKSQRNAGESSGRIVWGSSLAPILNQLQYRIPLPSPADVCSNPEMYLESQADPTAAIVYHTDFNFKHGVGAGVMPYDRSRFVNWVAGILTPKLRLTDAPKRVFYTMRRGVASHAEKVRSAAEMTSHEGRKVLGEVVGGVLTLDVLYENADMRDLILRVVCDDLGLTDTPGDSLGQNTQRWVTRELQLTIRTIRLGALGDHLSSPPNGGNARDRLHRAVQNRCDEVVRALSPAHGAMAAFVELRGKDFFRLEAGTDPKYAIRLGCVRAGRVVQFVTPHEADEDDQTPQHRVKMAWRDLLRQLGYQSAPPRFIIKSKYIPEPLQYVGIWLIRQQEASSPMRVQQQVPVAVRLTSDSTAVLATAPHLDEWLPYPDALCQIAQRHVFGGESRDREQVVRFIQQVVDDVAAVGDTVLFTHAQNLRGAWDWLGNTRLLRDQLRFGTAPPVPVENWRGLRHVRVRTSDQRETPEAFGLEGERIGISAGLWAIDGSDRVFMSTGKKPATASGLSTHMSKVDPRPVATGIRRPEAHKTAWNPQVVEFTVAAIQPGDDPVTWAAIAHELRSMEPYRENPLAYPLPLHLAQLIGEYVLPLREQPVYV